MIATPVMSPEEAFPLEEKVIALGAGFTLLEEKLERESDEVPESLGLVVLEPLSLVRNGNESFVTLSETLEFFETVTPHVTIFSEWGTGFPQLLPSMFSEEGTGVWFLWNRYFAFEPPRAIDSKFTGTGGFDGISALPKVFFARRDKSFGGGGLLAGINLVSANESDYWGTRNSEFESAREKIRALPEQLGITGATPISGEGYTEAIRIPASGSYEDLLDLLSRSSRFCLGDGLSSFEQCGLTAKGDEQKRFLKELLEHEDNQIAYWSMIGFGVTYRELFDRRADLHRYPIRLEEPDLYVPLSSAHVGGVDVFAVRNYVKGGVRIEFQDLHGGSLNAEAQRACEELVGIALERIA
jgi:hypothetical protein